MHQSGRLLYKGALKNEADVEPEYVVCGINGKAKDFVKNVGEAKLIAGVDGQEAKEVDTYTNRGTGEEAVEVIEFEAEEVVLHIEDEGAGDTTIDSENKCLGVDQVVAD